MSQCGMIVGEQSCGIVGWEYASTDGDKSKKSMFQCNFKLSNLSPDKNFMT